MTYTRPSEIINIHIGITVRVPLPTLPPFVVLLLDTRPFLPAGSLHPFSTMCGCRSPGLHKFLRILDLATLEADFVVAFCVLASRAANRLIGARERLELLRLLCLLLPRC